MSHKIAIITSKNFYSEEYDQYTATIIDSITDWEEVTDSEFKALQFASQRIGFTVLEQPTDIKKFVAKTVADYKAIAAAEEARAAKEKKEREDAALARKIKKEMKDKITKEKMLAKLSEELGVEIVKKV